MDDHHWEKTFVVNGLRYKMYFPPNEQNRNKTETRFEKKNPQLFTNFFESFNSTAHIPDLADPMKFGQ